jgi:hypothetical protein
VQHSLTVKGKEMDLLSGLFFWNITALGMLWYWVIAIVGFILQWRIEYAINGGGGDFLASFQEDFLWAIPGSRRRRGEYIRQRLLEYGGNSMGSMGGHSHEEIRKNNLYEEVGLKMLPGPFWFWSRIFVWIFWPTGVIALIVILIFAWALHGTLILFFGATRTQALYEKIFS